MSRAGRTGPGEGAAAAPPTRRRVLRVLGAAAGLPLAALAVREARPAPRFHRWDGEALGAAASLTLWGSGEDAARRTVARMRSEVERLEAVFSLERPASELSRLNRDGRLDRASPDLLALLEEAARIADLSRGAFDATVQPLWRSHEAYAEAHPGDPRGPGREMLEEARALVDHRAVGLSGRSVRLGRPGMAVTLNGIAQGWITDRIADLLRNEGFDHVVVDLGEIRALGAHPEGRPWRVGITDPSDPTGLARTIDLADRAVAVSGGYGTRLGAGPARHHILDPATGVSAATLRDVTVIAPRATAADALSTALYVAGERHAPVLLAAYPGARAILTRMDGTAVELG